MRKPDLVIGEKYLERWYIIPRNKYFNIYLHRFIGDDDDRAMHDHPWHSLSLMLKGSVYEMRPTDKPNWHSINLIKRWQFRFRRAEFPHRIILNSDEAWTLFITGRKIREWGFLCPKGWQHWSTMTDEKGNSIGGCE